jgi:CubicO group peptidase (beta-lactamase class C family)
LCSIWGLQTLRTISEGKRGLARAFLAAGLLIASASPALAAPPKDIDAFVARAMKTFGPPGLSLAIVEDGKTVLAKGYGVRRMGTNDIADEHTAFPIGSETKAFTAAAIAILVDEGKLKWTDRVVDKLPGFQMYDPYATEHMTIKDLLTHRSGLGLGEGDLLIVPATSRNRAEIVHALRYLKPKTGFREVFAYDNILYIVAGSLIEAVSGESWENFIQHRIFNPLGMTDSLVNFDPKAKNEISLHARTDGPIRGMGAERILARGLEPHVSAPAGAINLSAVDMGKWLAMWVNDGKLPNGQRLLGEDSVKTLWDPVVVISGSELRLPIPGVTPHLQDYALGWFIEDYKGHPVVEHTGAVLGAVSALFILPEKHVAFAISINSEDSGARRAVLYHLLDYYTGEKPTDWVVVLDKVRNDMIANALVVLKKLPQPPASGSGKTALPLQAYAGKYMDPWYGQMTISTRGPDKLWISFDRTPGMEGALEPVSDNRFRTRWTDRGIEDAYLDFAVTGGKPSGIAMKAISPLADFSFDYQDLHFAPAQ